MNVAVILTAVLVIGAEADVPPQMKVLEQFLGTWKTDSFLDSAERNPENRHYTRTEKAEVTLGGRYLQIKRYNDAATLSGLTLYTYHEATEKYRLWHFSSSGMAEDGTGQWDAETKTFTVTGDTDDGGAWKHSEHFIDENNREATFIAKNKDNEVFVKIRYKSARQK